MSQTYSNEELDRIRAPLHTLKEQCRKERHQYRRVPPATTPPTGQGRSDSPSCVALFQRAFTPPQDDDAWAAICDVFEPELKQRITRYLKSSTRGHVDVDDVLQDTFLRFWRSATSDKQPLATSTMGAIVMYMNTCIKSAVVEVIRSEQKHPPYTYLPDWDVTIALKDEAAQVEDSHSLESAIQRNLHTDEERLVFRKRFILGYKPEHIFAEHPDLFADMSQLRNTIQRLIRRLRKDTYIQQLWKELQPPRQKTGKDSSHTLNISMQDETKQDETKENETMAIPCNITEDVLLDYITGVAAPAAQAMIEQSPACLAAAQDLAQDILPMLHVLNRRRCPDNDTLVAYQEQQLSGTAVLVVQHHLAECSQCQEAYVALQAMDALFADTPTPSEHVSRFIRRIVEATFQPPLAAQVMGSDVLAYQSPSIFINLSTEKAPGKARTWSIWGETRTPAGLLATDMVESVSLEAVDQAGHQEEESIDEDGTFVFSGLSVGVYRLRILTAEEEIVVRRIPVGE